MKLSTPKRALALASLATFAFCGTFFPARRAQAEPMREFVLSCAYGTLAGTLVGVASLAFSDRPGDNLNRVARGASLGLYGGILLGAYIVNATSTDNDEDLPPGAAFNDRPAPVVKHEKVVAATPRAEPMRLQIYPLISDRGVEGGAARLSILSF